MRKSFLVEKLDEEDDIAGSHVRIRWDSTVTLYGSIVQKVKTLTFIVVYRCAGYYVKDYFTLHGMKRTTKSNSKRN